MNTNKTMKRLAPYSIGYTEQLHITGGRCVVTCMGWTYYNGVSTMDIMYSENGKDTFKDEVPDSGRPPAVGTVLAVYP